MALLILLLLLLLLVATEPCHSHKRAEAATPHEQVARMVQFVVHLCSWGILGIMSKLPEVHRQPFPNIFSLSDRPEGQGSGVPYFYLNLLQMSVRDLKVNPNATLTVSLAQTDFCKKHGFNSQNSLCLHVMMSGLITTVNASETPFAKKSLFSRHPEMEFWPTDHNWFFAKLDITNIWVIDFFGGAKTVTTEEYYKANP